ncbi:MAG: 23S rRNA (guanosine(2251)-2'-O)-methyltransferase RlmB [Eggerthellaceae bacterium]|nr:23S rRNA (guanosine(2251)-2'-O)-methyltransferase RlmB [Eggerthellaceae bacterium]
MAEYVEGKRPVIEAMKTDVPLKKILFADNAKRDPMVNDILRKARQRDIPVIDVPRAELDKKSARGSHQGVMAETKPFPYKGIGDIVDAAENYLAEHGGRALVVVCDHLTDSGNLGAIIRSAESVGASGVIIPNKRSAHVEASTYKSSAGAVAHLPIAQTSNIVNTLERFKKSGFWVCAATEHSSNELWDVNLKGKIVLVMGNEQDGISHLVLENCDMAGKLPMMGEIQSLNVAQSATACMYEWLRQNWS